MDLNDALCDAMGKYRALFQDLNLEIHTADCHSDGIHMTFWIKGNDKNVDIFPEIFYYDVYTQNGRWEEPKFDPDCDETYEDGYIIDDLSEKEPYIRELNNKTKAIDRKED